MGSGKQRWKISFHNQNKPQTEESTSVPVEFLCPIAGSLMADPVIVSSGHTFERNCLNACLSLSFKPTLPDASAVDFSTVIPNLALKSAILNWCRHRLIHAPKPIDFYSAEKIVLKLIPGEISVTSSDQSVTPRFNQSPTPLPFISSSSSSCDLEISSSKVVEEEQLIISKLKICEINEQEEALISLREVTRTQVEKRVCLCTRRLISALKSLITSRYSTLQVNTVAVLVNLSLEKQNKVKIVRSGIVPPLIDILRSGFPESQEHAVAAIFSLSLDDQNKTAIGVLGALPPLLHALRSDSERTRHDSALALYHLSLVQSNRVKMVKLGSIQILLGMVKSGHLPGRVMLILCNLAASVEGRAAMLDGGGVECLVGYLSRNEFDSAATRESCVSAIYGLSQGGLRFKGLAKEARAEEVLQKAEEMVSERGKQKVKRILEVMEDKDEEDEEIDWENLLNSEDDLSWSMKNSR